MVKPNFIKIIMDHEAHGFSTRNSQFIALKKLCTLEGYRNVLRSQEIDQPTLGISERSFRVHSS